MSLYCRALLVNRASPLLVLPQKRREKRNYCGDRGGSKLAVELRAKVEERESERVLGELSRRRQPELFLLFAIKGIAALSEFERPRVRPR